MKLIDKIKNFWLSRKQQVLPEANQNYEYINNSNNNNLFNMRGNNYRQLTGMEFEIEKFLNKYYNNLLQFNFNPPQGIHKLAYRSLIISDEPVTQEQYNWNLNNENIICSNWRITGDYNLQEFNGFYHVKSPNYNMPDFKDMSRVYVNCKNRNIADLADWILRTNTNPNFYMKFVTNEANSKCPRNEKMVIYCNDNEVEQTLEMLRACKERRPELFEKTKSLPFLKRVDNIANVAPQPANDYKTLSGYQRDIPKSVNEYLSTMLEESYVQSVNEIARYDAKLSYLFEPNNCNNEGVYMREYPYINENYRDYLLSSMKAKVENLARKNDIELDGMVQNRNANVYENQRNNQGEGINYGLK